MSACSQIINPSDLRPELVPGEAEQGQTTTAATGEPHPQGEDPLPAKVGKQIGFQLQLSLSIFPLLLNNSRQGQAAVA